MVDIGTYPAPFVVTSPTIRKRILKHVMQAVMQNWAQVTSPTIRKRILKLPLLPMRPPTMTVTSPTIRKRILKRTDLRRPPGRSPVTSPTIRKRILKPGGVGHPLASGSCYIAYDPQEDTETIWEMVAVRGNAKGYIAYDPQEDTETLSGAWSPPETGLLHRLRSARGY